MNWRKTTTLLLVVAVAASGWLKVLYDRAQPSYADAETRPVATLGRAAGAAQPVRRKVVAKRATAPADPALRQVLASPPGFELQAALHEFAASRTPEQLRTAIADAVSLENAQQRELALGVLLARLTGLRPSAALRLVLELDLGAERYGIVRELFEAWARADADQALAAQGVLTDPRLLQAAGDGILLAHSVPGALIDYDVLRRLPADFHPGPALAARLGRDAERDPADATIQALALEDATLRRSALHIVADTWTLDDPHAALDFVAAMGNPNDRWHIEHTLVERWVATDAEGLIAAIDAQLPPERRMRLLQLAVYEIAHRDPERALRYAAARDAHEALQLSRSVYAQWAAKDFSAATAHAAASLSAAQYSDAMYTMVLRYAENAPYDAMNWALAQPQPARDRHFERAVYGALQSDMTLTVDYIASLDTQTVAQLDLTAALRHIAEQDPLAAMRLLESLPDERRFQASTTIATSLARRDPQAAVEWVEGLPGAEGDRALHSVVMVWAHNDPAAAVEFAIGQGKYSMLNQSVLDPYTRLDPRAAFERLRGIDDGQNGASILPHVIRVWAETEPAAAARAALRIGDDGVRDNAMQLAVRQWSQKSPLEAAAWVGSLAESRVASSLVNSIAGNWARKDPNAALDWVRQVNPAAFDSAAQVIAHQVFMRNPDAGISAANQIGSESARLEVFKRLLAQANRLPSFDRRIIVRRAELSPERKSELEQVLDSMANP